MFLFAYFCINRNPQRLHRKPIKVTIEAGRGRHPGGKRVLNLCPFYTYLIFFKDVILLPNENKMILQKNTVEKQIQL